MGQSGAKTFLAFLLLGQIKIEEWALSEMSIAPISSGRSLLNESIGLRSKRKGRTPPDPPISKVVCLKYLKVL